MAKVHLETYGCTMNQADTDIIRGILSHKHEIVSIDEAELVVINSCGVIEYTERKILKRIDELKKNKKVVLAGCLPKISCRAVEKADCVIGTNVYDIENAVNAALRNEKLVLVKKSDADKSEYRCVKKRMRNNAIAIVPIAEGCFGKCTFCATKFARGSLRSYSLQNIVKEVEGVVKSGFREIQLTAQDTGIYGMDGKDYRIHDLLNAVSRIEGDFRVRVGMMNPGKALRIANELIDSFSSEKIYKFLHVPVQSGDNRVLEDMGRDHTVEEFIELVSEFRRNFKDVVISTDIIVGFPTENDEAFWKSYELIKEVKPEIVNITRYSERKNTRATKFKDMPDWIKKERSRKLTELCREISYKINSKFKGRKCKVLITKNGKSGTLLSRTNSYRPVILESGKIGEFYNVRIVDFSETFLKGEQSI